MGPGDGRVVSRERCRDGAALTIFHLVRHAEHGLLGRVLTGRMPGVGLSAAGRLQAAALADCFDGRAITGVVSSPLQRALETAGPIAERLGLVVAVDEGLDEIDFGRWTGRSFAELAEDPAWHAWNRFRSTALCPGGETMLAAQARAVAALTGRGEGEFVLVSHQDVLKAMLAHVLGMPLDHLQRMAFDPAHRAVVQVFADGARVDALNLPFGQQGL